MSDKDVMPIEVPTDEELFESEPEVVSNDEPVEAKAEEEVVEETDEGNEEPESDRDEKGRFKRKSEEQDHRVPLNELLNEREKRQRIEAQFEAMQAHFEQQQQQNAQQEQQWPDIFENPEYYQQQIAQMQQLPQMLEQHMQQQVNQQLAMARMEFLGELSLRSARERDPDTYKAAWSELEQRVNSGDQSWRQQVLQSGDPGTTLLELYKQANTAQTVGDDPEAYFQKRIEELKNDPQALAQLLGQPASQAPRNTRVDLPPSLTKAGSGSLPSISGRDLWDDINS